MLGTGAWDDMCTLWMNMVGTSTWREGLRGGILGRSDGGFFTVVFSDLDNWLFLHISLSREEVLQEFIGQTKSS